MRFLIVGGGSMGKRRTRCLLANKVATGDIRVVDTRADRRDEVKEECSVETFEHLDVGLKWDPDAVIVSVPGAYHMDVCLAAARQKKHVFCEVPLSTDLEGIDELTSLASRHKLVVAPGCQRPFHPLLKKCKSWIDESFGKVLFTHEMFGDYLPDWHPYEDYRKFYASDQEMGGGNIDVIAQELVAWYWLLGDRAKELCCNGHHLSTLELNGSDYFQIFAATETGIAMTFQFDMIQRFTFMGHRIVSEQGTIELNGETKQARRFLAATGQWETYDLPSDFQPEQQYIDEIAVLIDCIRGNATWYNPINQAADVVRFLLAMQKSMSERKVVRI